MTDRASVIQIERLNYRYPNGTVALCDVSFSIAAGEVVGLIGPNGAGKTTLQLHLNGLLPESHPDRLVPGTAVPITVAGLPMAKVNLREIRRQVGILFQDDLLFAHMTVRENLLFAVPPGPRASREAAVTQALADLELPGFADADPATLSGGQRARVALVRALLAQPQALLLDEPFSRLDGPLRERMREFVFSTVRRRQIPVVLVTHDAQDVADTAHLTRLADV